MKRYFFIIIFNVVYNNAEYDNYNYYSEQEKKLIGIDEDSKHSIKHAYIASFNNIKNTITTQWESFIYKQNIYDISHLDMSSLRQQYSYKLQDLGTYGTPTKLFISTTNSKITLNDGYDSFSIYDTYNEHFIYDTRAPLVWFKSSYNKYSHSLDLNVFLAASINKNLHFGIICDPLFQERDFGLLINEQEKNKDKKADLNTRHIPLSGYLFFQSDNHKHLTYLTFSIKHRKISETGGICKAFQRLNTVYQYKNNINDEDVINTNEILYKFLFYYQYQFQFFYAYTQYKLKIKQHTFDFNIEKELENNEDATQNVVIKDKKTHYDTINYLFNNGPNDINFDEDNFCDIYKPFTINDQFTTHSLEFGIKKSFSTNIFTRPFFQIDYSTREIQHFCTHNNLNEGIKNNSMNDQHNNAIEPLVGCFADIYGIKIHGSAMFVRLLKYKLDQCFYFNFSAKYEKRLINIYLNIVRQQVAEIFKYYTTFFNIRRYENKNFKDPFKIHIKIDGNIEFLNGKISINKYNIILLQKNHLYFVQKKLKINASCEPKQNENWLLNTYNGILTKINIYGPIFIDIDGSLNKRWQLSNNSVNEILKNIPLVNIYGRFYFSKDFAKDIASITTGIDVAWCSSYAADKYDPVTQHFFQQDLHRQQNIFKYPIINVFFTFRFSEFAFSAKANNLTQLFGLVYHNCCDTPYYPTGQSGYMFVLQYVFVD